MIWPSQKYFHSQDYPIKGNDRLWSQFREFQPHLRRGTEMVMSLPALTKSECVCLQLRHDLGVPRVFLSFHSQAKDEEIVYIFKHLR